MTFVLDASVALAWCFHDERMEDGGEALRVLEALRERDAIVAPHWTLEVANGLLTAERRGRIGAEEAMRAMRMILALPIAVDPMERARAGSAVHRLARTRGLSSYDAAYLELAIRMALPIATLDRDLRVAAEAEGVSHFPPN